MITVQLHRKICNTATKKEKFLDKNNNKNKDNSSFNHNMATINANKAVDLDVVNNNSIYNSNNDKGNS